MFSCHPTEVFDAGFSFAPPQKGPKVLKVHAESDLVELAPLHEKYVLVFQRDEFNRVGLTCTRTTSAR